MNGSFVDVPRPALVLGFGGVLPFYLLALPLWLVEPLYGLVLLDALIAYGAAILSFLGAVHWGAAMWQGAREAERGADRAAPERARADWARYGWSVVPALMAWMATQLVQLPGLMTIALGIALAYFIDQSAVRAGFFPEWYGALRKWLTVLVLIALAVAMAKGALPAA